mgnify:CR=1 FL=1
MPKLPQFSLGDLVLIEWHDAAVDSGWADSNESDSKVHLIQSIGWVIKKDRKAIIIAADKAADPTDKETNRRLAVPRSWIESVKQVGLD